MLPNLDIMMPNQDESLNFYAAGLTCLIGTGTVVAILATLIMVRFL
jgi:hypothetical protein